MLLRHIEHKEERLCYSRLPVIYLRGLVCSEHRGRSRAALVTFCPPCETSEAFPLPARDPFLSQPWWAARRLQGRVELLLLPGVPESQRLFGRVQLRECPGNCCQELSAGLCSSLLDGATLPPSLRGDTAQTEAS